MNLTKKEAIELHRKMWNWIADETMKKKRIVTKEDYFKNMDTSIRLYPRNRCYCCEYSYETLIATCAQCPIVWEDVNGNNINTCYSYTETYTIFEKWLKLIDNKNYKEAADLARRIANLPEKERSEDI